MDATVSAQLAQQSSARVLEWLAGLSTVWGLFLSIVSMFLVYGAWDQGRLRRKIEEDARKIDELRRGAEAVKSELDEMAVLRRGLLEGMGTVLQEAKEKGEAVREIVSGAEIDKGRLEELSGSVDSLITELEEGRKSLATVSGMAPDYSLRETSVAYKALSDRLDRERERMREVVKQYKADGKP